MSSSIFILLTVSFKAVPCKPSLFARLSDTQELLQVVSHKTNAVFIAPEELVSFNFLTWMRPLTSVTEDKVVVLLGCRWPVVDLLVPAFDFEVLMLLFVEGLAGKTLSAPWSKVLWELLQPTFPHLRGPLHWLNRNKWCLSRKQEKQSFASASTPCSLRRGLFLKDTAFPQPVAAFAYNSTSDWCWRRTLLLLKITLVLRICSKCPRINFCSCYWVDGILSPRFSCRILH